MERDFSRACSGRVRNDALKPEQLRFSLDIRKKFFTQRAVRPWHSCPERLWMPHPWRCLRPGYIELCSLTWWVAALPMAVGLEADGR